MSGDECIHGLGLVSACTICNGSDARRKAEAEAPTLIVTRYQSYCTECDRVIYPGDLIAWFPMNTRSAVHRDCYTP